MTGIVGCCARAATGHAATPPSSVMNSRRPIIRSPRRRSRAEKIDTCQVAARPREAGDKTKPDRVFGDVEDDRDRRGCRLGRKLATSGRDDRGDRSASQFGRQRRQSIDLILSPAVDDRYVVALDIAGVLEALVECAQTIHRRVRRLAVAEPDYRHRRLLRARRKRPCHRRAAEQGDELAPPHHSITSSARASSVVGTLRPSALAVLRLITVSYLFGACTGRSAGLSPLRIRST